MKRGFSKRALIGYAGAVVFSLLTIKYAENHYKIYPGADLLVLVAEIFFITWIGEAARSKSGMMRFWLYLASVILIVLVADKNQEVYEQFHLAAAWFVARVISNDSYKPTFVLILMEFLMSVRIVESKPYRPWVYYGFNSVIRRTKR